MVGKGLTTWKQYRGVKFALFGVPMKNITSLRWFCEYIFMFYANLVNNLTIKFPDIQYTLCTMCEQFRPKELVPAMLRWTMVISTHGCLTCNSIHPAALRCPRPFTGANHSCNPLFVPLGLRNFYSALVVSLNNLSLPGCQDDMLLSSNSQQQTQSLLLLRTHADWIHQLL